MSKVKELYTILAGRKAPEVASQEEAAAVMLVSRNKKEYKTFVKKMADAYATALDTLSGQIEDETFDAQKGQENINKMNQALTFATTVAASTDQIARLKKLDYDIDVVDVLGQTVGAVARLPGHEYIEPFAKKVDALSEKYNENLGMVPKIELNPDYVASEDLMLGRAPIDTVRKAFLVVGNRQVAPHVLDTASGRAIEYISKNKDDYAKLLKTEVEAFSKAVEGFKIENYLTDIKALEEKILDLGVRQQVLLSAYAVSLTPTQMEQAKELGYRPQKIKLLGELKGARVYLPGGESAEKKLKATTQAFGKILGPIINAGAGMPPTGQGPAGGRYKG